MEKDQVIDQVRPASTTSSDGDVEKRPLPKDPKWRPGFINQFPWLGFTSLVMILVCSAASVIILYLCDGTAKKKWPKDLAPNVLLGATNFVENVCFAIAIGTFIFTQVGAVC